VENPRGYTISGMSVISFHRRIYRKSPQGYLFSHPLPVGEVEVYFGGTPRQAKKSDRQH
jgi:hypothetical protein